jgi:hypothetical protein
MARSQPHTIGVNPLDQLVPYAATAAITGSGKRQRPGRRPETTVLTVTVPSDLAERLEQVIAVTPGLDLDSLASEALELVWAKVSKRAKGGARAGRTEAPVGRRPATTGKRGSPRDADSQGRKVVVILGE